MPGKITQTRNLSVSVESDRNCLDYQMCAVAMTGGRSSAGVRRRGIQRHARMSMTAVPSIGGASEHARATFQKWQARFDFAIPRNFFAKAFRKRKTRRANAMVL